MNQNQTIYATNPKEEKKKWEKSNKEEVEQMENQQQDGRF